MSDLAAFLDHMDWWGLVGLLISAAAALLCITFHELSHGFVAYRLGDPTAKNAGRLTMNPVKHIDPIGLVMMLVAKVGWAKPVPVDMRYFKHPKRGMALTALAGPVSNFLLAAAALGLSSLLYHLIQPGNLLLLFLCFLSNVALLSLGLGIFNLIPISPLDGSKVLFSFLPDKAYLTMMRYERYVMVLVVILTMAGVFQKPLSWMIFRTLEALCGLVNYPIEIFFLVQQLF